MPKVKLTGAILERLRAPASGQTDYFDAGYPGLALRVSAKGARSWVYMGRLHGKVRRVTLGKLGAIPTLKEARVKAATAAETLRDGTDPTADRKAKRERMARDTVAAVAAEWLRRDQAGNRSHDEVARLFAREVLPQWGARPISGITKRDAVALIDGMAERAPTYARRLHAHLHRMFRWAAGRDVIPANPMADLPKPGAERPRDRVLSDAELVAVWTAADGLGWPFGDVFKLLIPTGARRTEVGALRWAEIGEGVIELAGERSKTGEPRTIPLSAEAQAIINDLPRIGGAGFVFSGNGRTPVSGWSRAKDRLDAALAKALGEPLPEWRIHDLRRSVATGLQRLGQRLEVIEAVLGHTSGTRAGIVGTYQRHAFGPETRAALDAWARHVAGLVEPRRDNVLPMLGGRHV